MSAEKLNIVNENNITPFEAPEKSSVKVKPRVNINDLIARVKKEERKENKHNLVLFSLLATFVGIITIIIAY
tara:strand:+ start:212 stop:427 length:216 start_codon:yes stop_codon:yes gene_type:complete